MKLLFLLIPTVILLAYPSIGMNNTNTRALRACLSCKKNKIKCNGLEPCKKCNNSKICCIYPVSLKRGRKKIENKKIYNYSANYPTFNFINGCLNSVGTEFITVFYGKEILTENHQSVRESPQTINCPTFNNAEFNTVFDDRKILPENHQSVRENPLDDCDRFRVYSDHNFPELSKIFDCSTDKGFDG